MKSKPILVAAFLAIIRPAAAHEPGHVVVQNLELVMPGISAKSAKSAIPVVGLESVTRAISPKPCETHTTTQRVGVQYEQIVAALGTPGFLDTSANWRNPTYCSG
ncbi:hypothetical protein ABIA95_004179 [Bradyrhizobium sp. LA8.1]